MSVNQHLICQKAALSNLKAGMMKNDDRDKKKIAAPAVEM